MRVHWTTSYYGVANSFGYHVHNEQAKAAVVAAGVTLDDESPVALHVCPPHQFRPIDGKKNIIFTAWESPDLPGDWQKLLAGAARIVVTSKFLLEPLAAMFPSRWQSGAITACPLGVDFEEFPYIDRSLGGLRPNFREHGRRGAVPFRYLWVGAPNARKGAFHVLEAWRAFQHNRGFELYLKTSLPDDSPTRKGLRRMGNVIYDDRRVEREELLGIYHRAHCFVFPSLGEGFGLTFAEALATGLPAIYTPWTSLADIAPPELGLGFPVKFSLGTQNWETLGVVAKVANADIVDLVQVMIAVKNDPLGAFQRGKLAADHLRSNFTWQRCGQRLRDVIESVWQGS